MAIKSEATSSSFSMLRVIGTEIRGIREIKAFGSEDSSNTSRFVGSVK